MTDFQAFNASSHPIVKLVDDWNNLLHHGLEKTATYIIRKNGSYYEAIKGGTSSGAGTIAYGGADNAGATDGTSAADVIHAAWGAMTDGGRIHVKGDIDLGTTGLSFTLTKYVKDLILSGEGETGTTFTYTGAGYAITVTTADGAVGYYNVRLENFLVTGSAKTAGRHGIKIDKVGRTAVLDQIKVYYMDRAFDINATNEVYLLTCSAVVANTGFYVPNTTNEVAFVNCSAVDTATYGYYFGVGTNIRVFSGLAAPSAGYGIYTTAPWAMLLSGVRFEGSAAHTAPLHIEGIDGPNPADCINIDTCYFNASSHADYAIRLAWTSKITIQNCRSRNHNNAFIYLENHTQSLVCINNTTTDPYYFDSEVLTTQTSRIAGTVIEPRRTGLIVFNAATSSTVAEGDVVVPGANGTWVTAAVVNNNVPSVVMHGQAVSKPIVICINGVTQVYNDGATAMDDTIVTQNVAGDATTNNAQTDPKKIIGYAVEQTGGAGLAYVKIL